MKRARPGLALLHCGFNLSGGGCDLELDGPLRLVLQDDGARGNLFTVADVADLQGNEVAPAQFAVDPEVEEG